MELHQEQAQELRTISIEKISLNPFQPRRHFDPDELEELSASIRSVGLLHPPVVRPRPDGNGYELISGERRYRASKMAGLEEIPVLIRESTNMASAQAALIENVQRVDLNAMEIAKGLRRLMESFGYSQDELSDCVGKKRSTVANYLRLLSLPKAIQDSVNSGEISMGHAKVILSLDGFGRQMYLHGLIVRDGLSVREAEEIAQKIANEEPPKISPTKPPQAKDVYLDSLVLKIQEKLGTKVMIQGSGKKGKIVIDYYSLDDLDRLLETFGVTEK